MIPYKHLLYQSIFGCKDIVVQSIPNLFSKSALYHLVNRFLKSIAGMQAIVTLKIYVRIYGRHFSLVTRTCFRSHIAQSIEPLC